LEEKKVKKVVMEESAKRESIWTPELVEKLLDNLKDYADKFITYNPSFPLEN